LIVDLVAEHIAVITPIRYKAFGFKAEGRGQRAEGRGQRAEGKSKVYFTQVKIAITLIPSCMLSLRRIEKHGKQRR
jgi:hypothetical protein